MAAAIIAFGVVRPIPSICSRLREAARLKNASEQSEGTGAGYVTGALISPPNRIVSRISTEPYPYRIRIVSTVSLELRWN
jgi:hypothetical protein